MTRSVVGGLDELSTDDLSALRLAAQVMAHRAQQAGRPVVALYFDRLEAAVMAEDAARAQHRNGGRPRAVLPLATGLVTSPEDDLAIGEDLALLADNERLAGAVRDFCRGLGAGRSAPGDSA